MKRTILILTIIALQLPRLFAGNATDTLTSQKEYFNQAKAELEQMLSGAKPLDYERAVFITENAYLDNVLSYELYQGVVSFHATNIQRLAEANRKPQDFKPTLLETEAQQRDNYDKLLYNWAIYTYFTDITAIIHRNDGKNTIYFHLPFEYPTSDPMATLDWSNSQTINLLNNKAANCNAQVALYKIVSDRLKTGAKIGTAPSHAYIIHTDTRGTTYNVELPTRTFPGAGAIMTVTYSPVDAVRSGISMRSLTPSQSVALCLVYLAKGYEHKFGKADHSFTMNCSGTALRYDSLCLNAMLLKAEILEEKVTAKHKTVAQLQTDKDFIAYQKTVVMLYKKGYREMPLDMKNLIVSHLKQDTANFFQQNRTPRGFQSINPQDDRYATLSWGIYDEVHEPKRFEQFGRAMLDTKTMKLSKLVTADSLYNKYPFDPVIAAWQVDPLFAKYPAISPYVAFADNPILYIDPDGREIRLSFQSEDAKNTYINAVNRSLGSNVKISLVTEKDIDGYTNRVVIESTGLNNTLTESQQAFVDIYSSVVKDDYITRQNIVLDDENTNVGCWQTGNIDMSDINAFDNAGIGASSSAGALIHETVEQLEKSKLLLNPYDLGNVTRDALGNVTNYNDYEKSHKTAIKSENSVNGNTRSFDGNDDNFLEKDGTITNQNVTENASGVVNIAKTKVK